MRPRLAIPVKVHLSELVCGPIHERRVIVSIMSTMRKQPQHSHGKFHYLICATGALVPVAASFRTPERSFHGNQCPSARGTNFRAKTTPTLPWKVPLLDVCVRGRADRRGARVGGGCVSWFKATKKGPQTAHAPTHARHTGSNRHSAHHSMRSCHDKRIRHSTHSTRIHGGTVNADSDD